MCISRVASFQISGSKYPAPSKADGPLILKSHVNQKYWNLVKVELIKLYANIQQKLVPVPNSINTQLELSAAGSCTSRNKPLREGFRRPRPASQMEVSI